MGDKAVRVKGGASAPPFSVNDQVRHVYGAGILGTVTRIVNNGIAPRYLVHWNDKARTSGEYHADELVDAW